MNYIGTLAKRDDGVATGSAERKVSPVFSSRRRRGNPFERV